MASLVRINSFSANGRTLLSAGLTLALLILPIIIINAQEAIRAVPYTIREASYGLGATRWQTVWRQVLPAALPGIMTGTILSVSRAVGETAPLIVVGAATFMVADPTSPFAQFTAMADPDLSMDGAPAGAIRRYRRGRHHRAAGVDVDAECRGDYPAQPLFDKVLIRAVPGM